MISCEFCLIFKNSFSIEHLEWLLLRLLKNEMISQNSASSRSNHCVKSVQIRSYFWPVFSCIHYHIETSQLICSANPWTGFYMIMNTGKYGLEIIPYLDTFHAVIALRFSSEQVFLKMSHISQEKKGSNRSKKTPTQLFSSEICQIFNNNFFQKTLSVATFEVLAVSISSNSISTLYKKWSF